MEEKKRNKAAEKRKKEKNEKMRNRFQRAKKLIPDFSNLKESVLESTIGNIIFSNDKLDGLDDFKFIEQIVENLKSLNKLTASNTK